MENGMEITVSETTAAYAEAPRHPNINTKRESLEAAADKFWNSGAYFPAVVGTAALFLFSGHNIGGMAVIFAFLIFMHLFCSDLLAGVLPEVLLLLMGTLYYDNLAALLPYWWSIPVLAASYCYNLMHWRKTLQKSACFGSLKAVAAATLLGGLGCISIKEYFSVATLLYGVGLGVGMLVAGVMYSTSLSRPRSYDLAERFCAILYAVGVFAGFTVISYYFWHLSDMAGKPGILYISYRNYLTTMLLVALPMPFKFMKKSRLHIVAVAFMYAALLLTGSRSGLVFGTLSVAVCAFLTINRGKTLTFRDRSLILPYLAAAALIIFILGQTVLSSRLVDGQLFPVTDSRVAFCKQAVMDFLTWPLFGIGLGNMKNSSIFIGVGGSMVWYHNYFAQIIGSMGLFGIFAYGWLLRDRYALLKRLCGKREFMIVMAFAGMFMVSMTNPGEFCPYPNEFLMVLLFDVAQAIMVSEEAATASAESTSVVWTPARRPVPQGAYSGRANTLSLSEGSNALVLNTSYTGKKLSTASGTPERRLGGRL
jgi:hypothetical protein